MMRKMQREGCSESRVRYAAGEKTKSRRALEGAATDVVYEQTQH